MGSSEKVKYLLDTHILIWCLVAPVKLSKSYLDLLKRIENEKAMVGVSVLSLWESARLAAEKRLSLTCSVHQWVERIESNPFFEILPLSSGIILESLDLGPGFPKDPVDRFIVATARVHNLQLLTVDEKIRKSAQVIVV